MVDSFVNVELVQLWDALTSDEKRRAAVILRRVQPHVTGRKLRDGIWVLASICGLILVASSATPH
jgi:hypothetical protein